MDRGLSPLLFIDRKQLLRDLKDIGEPAPVIMSKIARNEPRVQTVGRNLGALQAFGKLRCEQNIGQLGTLISTPSMITLLTL